MKDSLLIAILVVIYVALVSAAVTDIIIATSFCILLRKHRAGLKRSNSVIRILMLYSVNTGILTSVCALACLITFVTMPHNQIYNALYWNLPTGTLYLNALLATLNARQKLRKSFDDHKAATLPVISILASMASGAGITPISLGQLTQSYNQNTIYQVPSQNPYAENDGPLATLTLDWQSSYVSATLTSTGVI